MPLSKEEKEEVLKEKVQDLNDLTNLFVEKVRDLQNQRKVYGTQFIYDGMDYLKVVADEMKQLSEILRLFGVEVGIAANFQFNQIIEEDGSMITSQP